MSGKGIGFQFAPLVERSVCQNDPKLNIGSFVDVSSFQIRSVRLIVSKGASLNDHPLFHILDEKMALPHFSCHGV